jgi:hypothetical protein
MATVVHDGDVSSGHQLCERETESRRTGACDDEGGNHRIGGAQCGHGMDGAILPKTQLFVEACHVSGGVVHSNY